MNLFAKYDVPVPRYTSYPALPHWTGISEPEWYRHAVHCAGDEISLYVHVPFCRAPCAFCGCTRTITRDRTRAAPYIETLLREADRKLEGHGERRLAELHLGGGTPTWLSGPELESLIGPLLERFRRRSPDFSLSLEIDPRTFTAEHVASFRRLGVTRASLGVQDFHEPTLKAIRREQPVALVADAVSMLREAGVAEVNFDLVYGLPLQTAESVASTVETVARLRPSRIAHYAYAHMPLLKPGQRFVEREGIPQGSEKWAIAAAAREGLKAKGYVEVGFDHFALPEDSLARAAAAGRLHRNFMGYTAARPQLLIGLGPSSLSDAGTAYAQNEKDLAAWAQAVNQGSGLLTRGHILSPEDLELRELVLAIMCRLEATVPARVWSDPRVRRELESLWVDGLIEANWERRTLTATTFGRLFLRTVAAAFDPHLARNGAAA